MSFKRAKVVMLPTNNEDRSKSNIYKFISNPRNSFDKRIKGNLVITASPDKFEYEVQHLYITSDEEIREGDWYYNSLLNIVCNDIIDINKKYCHKIIATTDNLITVYRFNDDSDKLPQPSQQFIEKYIEEYNKKNVITDVLVEYEKLTNWSGEEQILISETIKVNPKDNNITIKKVKDSWSKDEIDIFKNYLELILDYSQNTTSGNVSHKMPAIIAKLKELRLKMD